MFEAWSTLQLQDVMRSPICYGVVQAGPHIDDGVPCVRVVDLTDPRLRVDHMVRTTPRIHAEYRRTRLERDDILFALRGDIGFVRLVPSHLVGANLTRGVARLAVSPERAYPHFVLQALQGSSVRNAIRRRVNGSALKEVTIEALRRVPVALPPKAEQRAIAEVLGCADKQIDLARLLVKSRRKLKRGLLHQLLTGERRFPEFQDSPWIESCLGDVAKRVTRTNSGGSSHALTISGRIGFVDQRKYFSKMIAGESIGDSWLIKRGEFAYNRSLMKGYPFGATKRLDECDEGVVSKLYIVFSISEPGALDSNFLVHLFEAGVLNRQLCRISNLGSRAHGLLNVVTSDFFGMKVQLPSLPEQQRIAAALGTLDGEIQLLADLHAAMKEQKKGLMQQLLTGKIRVPESLLKEAAHA